MCREGERGRGGGELGKGREIGGMEGMEHVRHQYSTVQYSTVQHILAHHSTVQHVRHSTVRTLNPLGGSVLQLSGIYSI